MIERARLFLFFSVRRANLPAPDTGPLISSLESVFTNLVIDTSFILQTYEEDGVPCLSQAGP
jgi:hypothetical protein